jgi:site-specific DNA-methyltransferase (adenine-specific)
MASLPDHSIDMVLADLPYGRTQNKWDTVIDLDEMWRHYRRLCTPLASIVLTAAQPFTSILVCSNFRNFKYQWVWRKPQGTGFLNAKKQPLRDSEEVLIFYGKSNIYNPQMRTGFKPYSTRQGHGSSNYGKMRPNNESSSDGSRYPLSTLEFNRDRARIHPTQKPVALMEYLIRTYTHEGMTVLDNCMGSGTTGVACANTGRGFIGIERDPAYFEAARRRINETTAFRQPGHLQAQCVELPLAA